MKFIKIISLLIIVLLASCTGINKTPPQSKLKIVNLTDDTQQILITNYGYYLFNWIPLGCGGVEDGSFSLFSDHVNLQSAMQSFNEECKKLGVKDISNLQAKPFSTCFFSWVPYVGTSFGIYWYKEIQVSGVISVSPSKKDSQDENL